jgi:glycosyltransferase involved in cell wall biosynthesis
MMTLMEVFAERGHDVMVFNNPKAPGEYEGVTYLPLQAYNNRTPRDVIIIYRSPNQRYVPEHMPPNVRKIWWSTDQFTVGSFAELATKVDYVVTISPYHTKYHNRNYGIETKKMGHIDLGVRIEDYDQEIEKVEGRMIFCSIPDRGLNVLHAAWPLIKRDVDHASLVITSDYTLWGSHSNVGKHRLDWAGVRDVRYVGNIPRKQLVQEQLKAEIMSYPSLYEELFCISSAECSVAGALPVTSATGALVTTNEFGIVIPGNPTDPQWVKGFASRIVSLLNQEHGYLVERQKTMVAAARQRFDWDVIAERWEKLFEKGKL